MSYLVLVTAATEIAMVLMPRMKPCKPPPTVPETMTSQPTFDPALIPETTRSTSLTRFSNARMQLSPGVPSTAKALTG